MIQHIMAFCRITTGLVFAWSLMGKARDLSSFMQTMNRFQLLPKALHFPAAVAFLGGEFVVSGIMLLGGKLLLWGFLLAALLLILFSIALISVLIRKIQTPCNCFGAGSKAVSYSDVIRNAGFIGCAIGGWGLFSLSSTMPDALNFPELLLVGFVALTFVMIWTHLAEITDLFRFA